MGAYADLVRKLRKTEVMREVLASLEREPVALLYAICREYESSGEPVPAHHLRTSGYLTEAALRALVSAGLLQREPGGRLSVYSYRPTSEAMSCYRRLVAEEGSPRQGPQQP